MHSEVMMFFVNTRALVSLIIYGSVIYTHLYTFCFIVVRIPIQYNNTSHLASENAFLDTTIAVST